MSADREVITINKQALIDAIIALEYQKTLHSAILLNCLGQIDAMNRKVQQLLANDRTNQARSKLLALCLPPGELEGLLTDTLVESWEAEAKTEVEIPDISCSNLQTKMLRPAIILRIEAPILGV